MSGPLHKALTDAARLMDESGSRGALIGGLAVVAWATIRTTKDVDLVIDISPADIDRALGVAGRLGYRWHDEDIAGLAEGGFLRLDPADDGSPAFPINLLLNDTPIHEQVLVRAVTLELLDVRIPVATPEDLILLKLIAFRPQDTLDLDALFAAGLALDLAYLESWARRLKVERKLAAYLEP